MTAEILTWSRSRGLFAGVSLSGATLREDADWNNEMYGQHDQESRDRHRRTSPRPPAAGELLAELNKYSSRK